MITVSGHNSPGHDPSSLVKTRNGGYNLEGSALEGICPALYVKGGGL